MHNNIDNEVFLNSFIDYATFAYGDDEPYIAYAGAKKTLISFLFLYLINDRLELANFNNTEDYLKLHSCLSKIFTSGNFEEDILKKTFNLFEKNFKLPLGFLEIQSLKEYLDHGLIIFKENLNLHGLPSNIDCSSVLKDLISRPQGSKDAANTYLHYTNESLQQLVAKILNVKKTETFMDCCCGLFSSALYNDAADYIGVELDKEMAGIAAMIMIMCKKKFDLKKENFVESKYENVADKIFTDVSYGVEMPKMENRPYGKNGEAYCIENAVKALKDGGTAVVACSGSVLVKQDSSKKMREAITRDHLKAVIALPPMNNGTKSNTNLIVLEKNCHAKEIKFINASNLEIENEKRMTLNESDISDVIKCIDGEKSNCLSKNIKVEDVLNSGAISWAPNYYVDGGKNTEVRPIEVIDKELKTSYKELKKLMSE